MAVSLVFQGSDIEEVKQQIIDFALSELQVELEALSNGPRSEPEKKDPAKKKTPRKKKANIHDKVPEDPMYLFGDDGEPPEEVVAEEDPFGSTEPTIEDVKNALGEVVSAWDEKNGTGAAKAQKILQVYGDADDLGSLVESLYRKVIANSNIVVEKANG